MQITKSPYLAEMDRQLETVRTAVKGAPFIKAKSQIYLPNPSNATEASFTDALAKDRFVKAYEKYKAEAEFDDYTQLTERVMIGKMAFDKAKIDLPDKLKYLLSSADGDGLSMKGLLENCAQNVLAAKWHVVLCDYQGLTSIDVTSASVADIEAANSRVTLKEYPRESVYIAHYSVINGAKQLSLVVLREEGITIDPLTMSETKIESFLILGLDENGQYYQRKITQSETGAEEDSQNVPVSVNGVPVKFIPIFIVADEELTAGQLPQQLGFLAPISDICLARYNVSAKFKSALTRFIPTVFISGLTEDSYKSTKTMNGSNVIDMNGINILAGDDNGNAPTVEIVSSSGQLVDFHKYNEDSLDKLRSLGAAVPNENNASTATKAKIDAGQQNAVLNPLVNNLERMLKQLLCYAAMFEGLAPVDNAESFESQLSISLDRDFALSKGSVEDMAALVNLYTSGLRTKEQIIKMTHALGWDVEELQDVLDQVDFGEEM
jgi:hypothetical protein